MFADKRIRGRSTVLGILPILTLLYVMQLLPHSHALPGHSDTHRESAHHAEHAGHTHSHGQDEHETGPPDEAHHHHLLSDHMDLHTARTVVQSGARALSPALISARIDMNLPLQGFQLATSGSSDRPPDDEPTATGGPRAPPLQS